MALDFRRENNLDALRLGFATLVILSHSYTLARGPLAFEPLAWLTRGGTDFGKVAVDAFFAISGYLIPMSFVRNPDARAYARRRIGRIYPGFLVALLLSALVVAPLAGAAIDGRVLLRLARCAALLNEWGDVAAFVGNPIPSAVNGSMWTIRIELWCYVITLIAGMTGLLRRRWPVVAALVVTSALAAAFTLREVGHGPTPARWVFGDLSQWPRLLSFYFAGTLMYLYGGTIPSGRLPLAIAVAAVASIAASKFAGALLMPLGLAYLLFRLAFSPRVRLHAFSRWMGGDYSYGVYLYAWPIQQLLVHYVPGIAPLPLFAMAVPLTLACGAASWHLVEKRFMPRRRAVATEVAAPRMPGVAASA